MRLESVLITGASGYLGRHLTAFAPADVSLHLTRHHTPLPDLPEGVQVHPLDLADAPAVRELFARARPDLVIHTAATMDPARFETAIVRATDNVVEGCRRMGARLLHMSTDSVFDGERAPYAEADRPQPVSAYGQAKLSAEEAVGRLPAEQYCMVRTSLITGAGPLDPRSAWVVDSVRTGQPITLFVDELRCPIWVADLVAALWELAELPQWPPVLHVAGPEALSRYALGLLVASYAGVPAGEIGSGYSRDQSPPRPRDLRLDTRLAEHLLKRRLRPISELFGG